MSARRSQSTMEVWLPPAVRRKNNSLLSLAGATKANRIPAISMWNCTLVPQLFIYCKKTKFAGALCLFSKEGTDFWSPPMWQSVHIRPLCMQFVFHLIGVWQSACPPGLLPVKTQTKSRSLSLTHTHHKLSLSKTERSDGMSPETSVAAFVWRLTSTWLIQTTDVPLQIPEGGGQCNKQNRAPLRAVTLKRMLPHGEEESEQTLTKGNITSRKLEQISCTITLSKVC